MTFKQILQQPSLSLNFLVLINENPVWDYKAEGETVYLISEDPWEGVEDEQISVQELKEYCDSLNIDFSNIKFATEADKEILNKVLCTEDKLVFSH